METIEGDPHLMLSVVVSIRLKDFVDFKQTSSEGMKSRSANALSSLLSAGEDDEGGEGKT